MTTTTQTDLHPVLTHYIAWIKAHEKLLVIVLGAWLAFHFYGRALDLWDAHDKRAIAVAQQQATIAQQKVEQDADANKLLLAQVADLKQQFQTLQQQTQASQAKRQADTDQQKKQNDTASIPELIARFRTITSNQQLEITPSPSNDNLVFSDGASRIVLNQLEDGQNDKATVAELNQLNSSCTALNVKQQDTITGLQTQITHEQESHVADVKLKDTQIAELKVENKKAFRKGLKIGYIGGIATAIAIKIAKVF